MEREQAADRWLKVRLTADDMAALHGLQAQLQLHSIGRVGLRETLMVAVGSASAALSQGGVQALSFPSTPIAPGTVVMRMTADERHGLVMRDVKDRI